MPRDEEDDIPTREDEGEDKEDVKEVVVEEEPASIVIRQAASVFVRPPIKLWRATSSRPVSKESYQGAEKAITVIHLTPSNSSDFTLGAANVDNAKTEK